MASAGIGQVKMDMQQILSAAKATWRRGEDVADVGRVAFCGSILCKSA